MASGLAQPVKNLSELNYPAKSAKMELIYKEESCACFEVYKNKGCGFLEPVYQECLEIELGLRGISFRSKFPINLHYKEHLLSHGYEPDFTCFDSIILEIKAVEKLSDGHRAQVLNYLAATGFKLGLLVNFGHYPQLEWQRIANTK